MIESKIRVKPSIIIQCIQSALALSRNDCSEASAIREIKAFAKLSKKKRAMAEIVIDRNPKSRLQCTQCALEYIKMDSSEAAADRIQKEIDNNAYTPEGDDGLPTGYGYVGLENLIQLMGYDKHTRFTECVSAANTYWLDNW